MDMCDHTEKELMTSRLTPEEYAKQSQQLEYLLNYLNEIADYILEGSKFSDFKENLNYEDAKNEQALVEKKIMELQSLLEADKEMQEK